MSYTFFLLFYDNGIGYISGWWFLFLFSYVLKYTLSSLQFKERLQRWKYLEDRTNEEKCESAEDR